VLDNVFFCPVCGHKSCDKIGIVCSMCRIQAKVGRQPGGYRIHEVCFYCHRETVVCVDHVVPISRGGPEEEWNRVLACVECNQNKSDKLPSEWCPDNERALEIERRVPVVFPRMRKGKLSGDKSEAYARVILICEEFLSLLSREISSLPGADSVSSVGDTVRKHVHKLRLKAMARLNDEKAKPPPQPFRPSE